MLLDLHLAYFDTFELTEKQTAQSTVHCAMATELH